MWSFWICDTRTGAKQLRVEPADDGQFSHRLSGGYSGTDKFVLTGDSPLLDDSLTAPWSRTLVRCWNDVPKYAGLIASDAFADDTQMLTVKHVDVESFLSESRYPFGVSSYWADEPNHIPGSLTIASKSVAAAVGKVVEQSLLGPYDTYSLPVVVPNVSEAGSFTKTYYNYHFQTVGDILEDFRALGYDIEFEPRWSGAGALEWLLRVGTDAAPSLVGDSFDFNQTAPERRLKDVSYTRDGTMQITGQFGVGEGSEVDMRVGGSGVGAGATIPARDAAEFYKSESSEPLLAEYGAAAVAAHTDPSVHWEMRILADEEPGFENLRLGSIVRMYWKGNARIPDGFHDARVIGYSGGGGTEIVLDAQTWGG